MKVGDDNTGKDDESPNAGLHNPGFRNYADYMATNKFRIAVQELLSTTAIARTVVMCAEKLSWKCHRILLSDYLTAGGVEVKHILDSGKLQAHKLSQGAVITTEATVVYPPLRLGTDGYEMFCNQCRKAFEILRA